MNYGSGWGNALGVSFGAAVVLYAIAGIKIMIGRKQR